MSTLTLYDRIGAAYDRTRRADPRIVDRLAAHLAPRPDGAYVDIGCGTGNYTCALAAHAGRWYGIDASAAMLAAARRKCAAVCWCHARVARLPLADACVDGVICTLVIHYFGALVPAFSEIRRVLGRGRLVLFTSTPAQLRRFWLNHYFPQMMARAIVRMPELSEVERALASAGFTEVHTEPFDISPDHADLFLFGGKHRPELYVLTEKRQGMSPFTELASAEELESGVSRLRADIDCGRISAVMKRHDGGGGDYTFIIAA